MSTLLVFPGQGAQRPGMLQGLPADFLRHCSEVLGEPVEHLDSEEALHSTRAVQLCLLIAGIEAWQRLQALGATTDYVAGLSIGAYPAAVAAGALDFDDALRLVALRGQLMHDAHPDGYGMTAILGLELGELEPLLLQAQAAGDEVYLANINAPRQLVISGPDAAMQALGEAARVRGATCARRLAVSTPSHCPLLSEQAQQLATAIASVELHAPRLRYLSGSNARLLRDAQALREDLAFNMCRTIDWSGALVSAYERGVRLQVEMPPGTVLTGLARSVFSDGRVAAFEGTRIDSLAALMRPASN
ncbi:malonate decarboxylase subunit epsilon [Pseudomonas sp. PDM11]|uniref:malonate decarboxylase subunit epsilon n=1 Tax=Pseudomonas sp. PDM11 TaxID=2769309 RepID=UPI00177C0D22|nr:malonate decarboxylase subunit epsilon [Pseudomonas sp. PDM11]MBD9397335.1 malonate decarboxylase subunit epsilon [Pseudomonas sp. PDM11]